MVLPKFSSEHIEIQRWTSDPRYQLKPHQIRAAKARAWSRGGILGFEVGVGKTFTALAVIAIGREEGWIRKPVVMVPPRLAFQWVAEISKVLPDYSVLVIGRKRTVIRQGPSAGKYREVTESAEERVAKWTEFQAGFWDIAIVTETAFKKLKINQAALTRYVEKRTAIMRSIIVERRWAKTRKTQTERQKAILEMGAEAWVKYTIAVDGKLDPGIGFDDIGIDFLVIDEVGLYRNSFAPMNRPHGTPKYMGSPGSKGSSRAWQADLRSAIIRQRTGGRGVLALTGTLGENSPIEIYNIFHLIDPTIFERIGLTDPETWLDRYLDIDIRRVIEPTGDTKIASAVVGFKNLLELREILFRWGSFISARRAELPLPESSECFATVVMNEDQKRRYAVHRADARSALKKRKKGQAFAAMNRMRSVALHPEIEDGYTWSTATGGLATAEVSAAAVPYRIARGWKLKADVLAERIKAAADPEKRDDLKKQLAKVEKSEAKIRKRILIKDLPPPKDMSCPKFEAVTERVLRNTRCGHLIFVTYTAAHWWLREVMVRRGVPRERIAIINGEVDANLPAVAKAFNGTDEDDPTIDIIIANSTAYRGANLQRRTCAIHNLDLTFTPAEIEQRRGRGDRYGNTLDFINIWFYFTQGSYDSFLFGLISGKADWHDQLYHAPNDRTTNPQKQLDLDESAMLALTAESPEEQAAFAAALKAEAERRRLDEARGRALRLMAEAAGRYRMVRAANDPEIRAKLESEAQERLRRLASTSIDVWPWRSIQDVVRTQDVFVFDSVLQIPVFSGLLYTVDSKMYQVGRLIPGVGYGVREFGSHAWSLLEESPKGAHVVQGEDWSIARDREQTVASLKAALANTPDGHVSFGWPLASQSWLEPMWDDFGTSVLLSMDDSATVPFLDNGIRIPTIKQAKEELKRVVPPTYKGWEIYSSFAELSQVDSDRLSSLADRWWKRSLPDLRSRSRVTCPHAVERLRPPWVLRQLEERHASITKRQRKVVVSLTDVDGGSHTYTVQLGAGHTVETLALEVMRAIYRRYFEQTLEFAKSKLAAASKDADARTWKELEDLERQHKEKRAHLGALLGLEAAMTVDACASKATGLKVMLSEIVDLAFRPSMQGEWWKSKETLQRMAKDLKRVLRARGLADKNTDKLVASELKSYIAEASGKVSTAQTSTKGASDRRTKGEAASSTKETPPATKDKDWTPKGIESKLAWSWSWGHEGQYFHEATNTEYLVAPVKKRWIVWSDRDGEETEEWERDFGSAQAAIDAIERDIVEHENPDRKETRGGGTTQKPSPVITGSQPEAATKPDKNVRAPATDDESVSESGRITGTSGVHALARFDSLLDITLGSATGPYTLRVFPTKVRSPRQAGRPIITAANFVRQGPEMYLQVMVSDVEGGVVGAVDGGTFHLTRLDSDSWVVRGVSTPTLQTKGVATASSG